MTYWEQISREAVNGFDIVFSVAPEDMHPGDSFDPECFDIPQLCEDINRGRYSWFIARVQAFRAAGLGADFVARALSALIRAARTNKSRAALMEYAQIFAVADHPEFIV